MRRITSTIRLGASAALGLLALASCGDSGRADEAATAKTREVLVVSNNWDGTADFIDPKTFQRLMRLDIVPDKAERMAEIAANPVRLALFLGVRQLIGEGHDQYVDDGFTSHDGRYLYVSRPSFADVVAFDLTTKQIVWRTPVEGYRSDHMAISPDGTRLAVSASTSKQVHMIDTATGTIIGSFASGDQPHESNYSKDGKRIFHASIGTVFTPTDAPVFDTTKGERVFEVVDPEKLEVLKKIDIGEKLEAAGYPGMSSAIRPMAIAPGEKIFYFQLSFLHGFVEYDLEHDRILRVLELPMSDPDMPRSQYLLDSAHHGLAMDAQGEKLCVAGTMDDYAAIVHRDDFSYKIVTQGSKPYWATNSADGRYCFVSMSGDDAIAVIDYANEEKVTSIPVGDHPQRSRMGRLLASLAEAPAP